MCSTPGRWILTGCLPTTKSTISPVAVGVDPHGLMTRPTRPACATARSAFCRMRTWTAFAHPGAAADAVLQAFPQAHRGRLHPLALPPLFRWTCWRVNKKPPSRSMHWMRASLMPSSKNAPRTACRAKMPGQPFSGSGRMNAEQLWETTLNPDTRRLLPVQFAESGLCRPECHWSPSSWAGRSRRPPYELDGAAWRCRERYL